MKIAYSLKLVFWSLDGAMLSVVLKDFYHKGVSVL